MADTIPAPYSPSEIPEHILKGVGEINLNEKEVLEIAKDDSWFLKLQKKRDDLVAMPQPTTTQIRELWQAMVKAYWRWITAKLDKEDRAERIKRVEGQMRLRLIELRKKHTLSKVERIQRRLGRRFHPELTSAGQVAVPPSPTTT